MEAGERWCGDPAPGSLGPPAPHWGPLCGGAGAGPCPAQNPEVLWSDAGRQTANGPLADTKSLKTGVLYRASLWMLVLASYSIATLAPFISKISHWMIGSSISQKTMLQLKTSLMSTYRAWWLRAVLFWVQNVVPDFCLQKLWFTTTAWSGCRLICSSPVSSVILLLPFMALSIQFYMVL